MHKIFNLSHLFDIETYCYNNMMNSHTRSVYAYQVGFKTKKDTANEPLPSRTALLVHGI